MKLRHAGLLALTALAACNLDPTLSTGASGTSSGGSASGSSSGAASGSSSGTSSGSTSGASSGTPSGSSSGTSSGTTSGASSGTSSGSTSGSSSGTSSGTSGASSGTSSGTSSGSSSSGGTTVTGPCDLYERGGTPCVAAHSTVRALYGAYDGSLYQVRRVSDGKTAEIGVLAPGGFANSAAQDTFCAGTRCTISILYDQSPRRNHLTSAPAGGAGRTPDREADAASLKLQVGGHPVYALYVEAGVGYRNNRTTGVAKGDEPEGMYMVTSGKHHNGSCCFDYGNAETNNLDNGNGTMEAIYFGSCTIWGRGRGSGPWVMADLENGLFAGGNGVHDANTPVPFDYVTAMLKGKPHGYAIKAGDAQSGPLQTMYDGPRPTTPGYDPMKKEGAIILGIGGDNSNLAVGTFFEGCMTSGYPPDATEDAVQANILAVGYGRATTDGSSGGSSTSSGGTSSSGGSSGASSSGTSGGSSGGSSGAACPAGATLRPGNSRRTISAGGKSRSYVLHVPQSYGGTTAVPLVLDFHGYGGDGAAQQAGSGFDAQSDQHGFVIAYPDAVGGCWNPGVPGLSCGEDDVGLARAIVRELSTQGCIDPRRVYANGFSQGGGMAYALACNAADLFAGATASGFDLGSDCRPSRPVSVLSFRGTADRYDGSGNALIGAPNTLQKWKELDGCTGATTTWNGCAVYQTCTAGTEAGLCTIQGGGHAPGSAETGWAFLSRHALP